ncbi:MAG: hypothetical protein JSR85_00470 [Proteobacteria bacterium]|nr:hypothetical protein [Pseudomonadota bacterium]
MNYKFFSVVVLLFNSMINFFVSPAYGMDIWDIHTNNWKSLPKVKIYSRQDRDIYDVHRDDSEIYSSGCPKAPLFSTYYPERHQLSILPTQLYSHVPLASFLKLPEDIRRELEIDGVDPRSTKIFVVGQRAPSGATFTGLYPHFGTEPMAPTFGAYDVTRHLKLMITDSDSRKTKFERMPNEGEPLEIINVEKEGDIVKSTVKRKSVITHPIGGDNQVVLSPVPVRVVGIEDAGQSFYTYASYPDEKGVMKGIVTLHLLWSHAQYRALDEWSRANFGLGPRVATRSTEELARSFDDLIRSPAFRGGKHFQRFVDLLQGVTLKEAVSSPKAFETTFDPRELITAYDFSNGHYVGMSAKERVKEIFTQRGYKDWDALSAKEQDWVTARVRSQAERNDLIELLKKQDYSGAFNKLKATTSESDEGVVKFLLSSNGYGKWETFLPETQKWVVSKVKEVAQLEEFLSKKDYVEAFNKTKATTSASDEEVVKFLLSSNGYGKWDALLYETQKWVVAKIKFQAERKNLTEFLKKQDYAGAFNRTKATTRASDEEIVKFLLTSNGYKSWVELDSDNKAWVVARVSSKVETSKLEERDLEKALGHRAGLQEVLIKDKLKDIYRLLKDSFRMVPDEQIISYVLHEKGYKNWTKLSLKDRQWIISVINGTAPVIIDLDLFRAH